MIHINISKYQNKSYFTFHPDECTDIYIWTITFAFTLAKDAGMQQGRALVRLKLLS